MRILYGLTACVSLKLKNLVEFSLLRLKFPDVNRAEVRCRGAFPRRWGVGVLSTG
jgi:hypothetical protein